MLKQYETIKQLGCEILVITFVEPKRLVPYLARRPWPVPVVADPNLAAYRAFGLGRASTWSLFRPGVILRYLWHILHGWLPGQPEAKDDLLQLGGDFIMDEQRRIVFVYRSADPTDRPSARKMLKVLRSMRTV